MLGAAGVVALIASGLLLYDTNSSAFEISAPVVIVAGVLLGGAPRVRRAAKAVQARRQPKRTGWEEMIGAIGEVRVPLDPVGQVFVQGALWRARRARRRRRTRRSSAAIESESSRWMG